MLNSCIYLMCTRLDHDGKDGNSLLVFKPDYSVRIVRIQFNMNDRSDLNDYFLRLLSTQLLFYW